MREELLATAKAENAQALERIAELLKERKADYVALRAADRNLAEERDSFLRALESEEERAMAAEQADKARQAQLVEAQEAAREAREDAQRARAAVLDEAAAAAEAKSAQGDAEYQVLLM